MAESRSNTVAHRSDRRAPRTTGRIQPNVDTMFVLRTEDGKFLGRGGKHLSLCLVDDKRDASAFATIESACDDASRAEAILGVSFTPVREPVKNLIRKEKQL